MRSKRRLSRRSFLKTAGAAFAFPAIIPSSALGADGAVAPSERIVMAAIGTGGQGMGNMGNFLGRKEVQMVAVCDVDTSHRNAAKENVDKKYQNSDCQAYNDFREITRRDDIDAVCIGTPDHWHVIPAIDAAKNKKDIYVEKPLTLAIGEGRVLSDVVKQHGRILQTGSQQRSSEYFWKAAMLARNGKLGTINQISVGIPGNNKECGPSWTPQPVPEGFDYNMWLGPAPWAEYHPLRCHYTFRFILDYSGGQVTNFGAHHLDIAQWALDMDESGPVEVSGNGAFPETGLFTTATKVFFECTYANGVKLYCKTGGPNIQIEGSEGSVRASRKNVTSNPASLLEADFSAFETQLYRSNDHHQNFLECVKSRKQPICTAEVGHRSATVCHLGNISMQLGRTLKWDPKAENFGDDQEANSHVLRAMREPWSLA
ncbi:MAG: Gfo/Idh/MocA family oxidoreductase [Candidatus Hydrogenedentes bacterium]|nr:Gfo/Idh/MocA family oxidoreductase [Candidatus Hydrogenedentota bacterium]